MTDFEREDMELEFIMGDKFQDLSKAKQAPAPEKKAAEKPAEKPKDAQWHPVKPKNNLAECAKWSIVFGGLGLLVWYWEISGLMDESIALPCMLVCALLAGVSIGKVFGGEK